MSGESDGAHLDEVVRPDLTLPDPERIARIDRDRWVGYGLAREAFDELDRILRSERRQRPDNLLVVGASNNGKTAIAPAISGAQATSGRYHGTDFDYPGHDDPGRPTARASSNC